MRAPRRSRVAAAARVSPQEAAWARAVGVVTEMQARGLQVIPVDLAVNLLSLDEARHQAATAWASERLAIPAEADPITGCLPVTAKQGPS